jgi:tetratricopeptide (TPR) repeat protein
MLAALLGVLIARPAAPRREGLVAAAALTGLWIWAVASTGWAESADQAMTEANRWLLYAALFGVLVLLLRTDRLGAVVVGAGAVAVGALAIYLVARMLAGSAGELFLVGRLNEPLGYINGQAGYLLIGVWPFVALAERARQPLFAGAGAASAACLLGMVLLSQTRAIVPAVFVSVVLMLVCVPGRTRRAWVLGAIACGVIVMLGPVLEVYDSSVGGEAVDDAVVRNAAVAIVFGGAVAGGLCAIIRSVAPKLGQRVGGPRARLLAWTPLAAGAAIACVVALSAADDPVGRVTHEYRSFVKLQTDVSDSSRFTSGAGNRYDYWRIAWSQFRDEPLRGMGAGNYDRTYFAERRSTEDIRQPHSIELQALAELGVVGGAALALFLGAVLLGFMRRVRAARTRLEDRGLAVAAGGAFLVWLVHTSVDWLHLIPGVTGLALASAAVLVGPWRSPGSETGTPVRRVVVLVLAVLIVGGATLVGRSALAEMYRSDARELIADAPARAISKADDSLALNDEALPTYYVKAAAYARLDDYRGARSTLLEATRREPHDFVAWGLLGDLAVRRGAIADARRAYRTAARLNPRNPGLAALAKDPLSALDK